MPDLPVLQGAHRQIVVFRALQLGDLLCAVPALRALRAAQPEARVTLVSLPWAAAFARRFHRYVDDFIPFPGHPALPERTPERGAFPAFLEAVQARDADLALQLHGSGDVTNPLVALFGARRMAGFVCTGAWVPDEATFHPYRDAGHEVERLLGLLTALGAPSQGTHLEFPLDDGERVAARHLLDRTRQARPYAIVHPGGRAAGRRWLPAAFAEVAKTLDRLGLDVVVTGSDWERPIAGAVCAAAGAGPVNLAGETTLGTLGALVESARLVVTNDTGVSHIAAALGTPSVVLFAGSDPDRWAPLATERHRALPAGTPLDNVFEAVREQLLVGAAHA